MKITKQQIEKMKDLKKQGKKNAEIARELNINSTLVGYHLSKKIRDKSIARAKKNQKENKYNLDKKRLKAYQKEYHKKRYQEDEEFREKAKERSREYWRNKK